VLVYPKLAREVAILLIELADVGVYAWAPTIELCRAEVLTYPEFPRPATELTSWPAVSCPGNCEAMAIDIEQIAGKNMEDN